MADAAGYAGSGYDLIAFFDALHDLGDPVGAARHARAALADDGSCMLVEPFAGDRIEDNLNPVGRFYYGFSTLVCTPGSLSQPGRAGLGTQAGEARLREVMLEGGFGTVRRAAGDALEPGPRGTRSVDRLVELPPAVLHEGEQRARAEPREVLGLPVLLERRLVAVVLVHEEDARVLGSRCAM